MELTVLISQNDEKTNYSNEYKKLFNIGNAEIESIALEISTYLKDLHDITEKNKSFGFRSTNIKGLKENLVTELQLIANNEAIIVMSFRRLSKFVANNTKKDIQNALSANIAFQLKHA